MKLLSNKSNLQILFEDNHIIVINKRAGDIVQGDKTGDQPLSEVVKEYIKDKYNKPGSVYLGVVHRLDRPTTGIVVFAKKNSYPCKNARLLLFSLQPMLEAKLPVPTQYKKQTEFRNMLAIPTTTRMLQLHQKTFRISFGI